LVRPNPIVKAVSPRRYQLGRRQALIDESRRRVVDAARELLAGSATYTEFTIDAVARQADVARATVYYQFGSKTGLIEAVCDALAGAGGLGPDSLGPVIAEADPRLALGGLIDVFARFWSTDRAVLRRLRALAALDPEVGGVIAARDGRLDRAVGAVLARIPDAYDAVPVVRTLLRFETFDSLAGPDRHPLDVTPIVARLVEAALPAARDMDGRGAP
jgi:AcrR family transcriptional regulator